MSTVYLIRHLPTGKILYIGKTNNFKVRKQQHMSLNTSTSSWLNKIGIENISIEKIAECKTEYEAIKMEGELIDMYDTITNGYNKRRSGHIYASPTYKQEYNKAYCSTDEYRDMHRELVKTDKYRLTRKLYEQTEECKRRRQITNHEYYIRRKMKKNT